MGLGLLADTATFLPNYRTLVSADGYALHNLVAACPPLDTNSVYCNLLQAGHFSATSYAAFVDPAAALALQLAPELQVGNGDSLVASVTGYWLPDQEDHLFIWQVAVHPALRGRGIGLKLLQGLLAQPLIARRVKYLATTITADNSASWALFTRLASKLAVDSQRQEYFDSHTHFAGKHASEWLFKIGPFA